MVMAAYGLPMREFSAVLAAPLRRGRLRGASSICWACALHRRTPSRRRLLSVSARRFAEENDASSTSADVVEKARQQWDEYKQSFHFPPATPKDGFRPGAQVSVHGFLSKRRDLSAKAAFVDVVVPGQARPVQIRSAWETEDSPAHALHQQLRAVPPYSAVAVSGTVEESSASDSSSTTVLVRLGGVQVLNAFPRDIIVSKGANFPATARHLQMRFSPALQRRLAFRSDVAAWSRRYLAGPGGLQEFETPVLFKSTPEGAREFLVPTRRRGYAYALPQSPQQFKQILMASGAAAGYFQFARCFRDEDLRADRQPEFTQIDLEKAFASGEDIMQLVEGYIKALFAYLGETYRLEKAGTEEVPTRLDLLAAAAAAAATGNKKSSSSRPPRPFPQLPNEPFLRITYEEAMSKYGSDKPDLRIPGEIHRLDHLLPRSFTSMITSLEDPIVEACRFRLNGTPRENRAFVHTLFDNLPPALAKNPHGMPAVLFFDPTQPLCGLAPVGHEAFDALTGGAHPELADLTGALDDGDVLFLQARPQAPFGGAGSTALGQLRLELYRAAAEAGLLPTVDDAEAPAATPFRFLWVVGFPMFTAASASTSASTTTDDDGPGQGGRAGFAATHHPFTAPRSAQDFALLATDPLRAVADHYDLVVNGVELGGGSRRIHIASVQEYVLREILQMDDAGVAQFAHLLAALRAGCPPHAGLALGFDRLVAVLSGTASVRDVIAFPKSMKGEDLSVKSPGRMTPAQLETYHLALAK